MIELYDGMDILPIWYELYVVQLKNVDKFDKIILKCKSFPRFFHFYCKVIIMINAKYEPFPHFHGRDGLHFLLSNGLQTTTRNNNCNTEKNGYDIDKTGYLP